MLHSSKGWYDSISIFQKKLRNVDQNLTVSVKKVGLWVVLGVMTGNLGCSSEEPSFVEETQVIKLRIDIGENSADALPQVAGADKKLASSAQEIPSDGVTEEMLSRIAMDLPVDDLVRDTKKTANSPSSRPGDKNAEGTQNPQNQIGSAGDSSLESGAEGALEIPSTSSSQGSSPTSSTSGGEGTLEIPGSEPPPPSPLPNGSDGLSQNELKACAALQGVTQDRIMIVGHKGQETKIDASMPVVAYKLVGDQPRLILDLVGKSETKLGGLCLFLTAHKSVAEVKLGVSLGRLVYFGRGDSSRGLIEVSEGRKIESLAADLSGNQPFLKLFGAGQFPCTVVKKRGNSPIFECK